MTVYSSRRWSDPVVVRPVLSRADHVMIVGFVNRVSYPQSGKAGS